MEVTDRRLMWHGMFLFRRGLLTGFAEHHFVNIRMGLAAHLEGVMNGIFLLALGRFGFTSTYCHAQKRAHTGSRFTVLMDSFFTVLAAAFGTLLLSHYRSGSQWARLARARCHHRIHQRRHSNSCGFRTSALGPSRRAGGGQLKRVQCATEVEVNARQVGVDFAVRRLGALLRNATASAFASILAWL